MLLYLLSKKIFQKIRPSPADGKADGGTWFGNFYLTFRVLYHILSSIVAISQRTRKPSAKRKLAFMLC